MLTIGVAIAIPEPWATQLQDYRTAIGDRMALQIPTHITLVPPVEVAADDLPALEQHLEATAATRRAFRIHLRGTGTFRPVSPVVFVSVVEGISECEQLAGALRRGPLAQVSLDFPYHPHVTIAHHLDDVALDRAFDELSTFDAQFRAGSFALYLHEQEEGWRPERDFELGAR